MEWIWDCSNSKGSGHFAHPAQAIVPTNYGAAPLRPIPTDEVPILLTRNYITGECQV
jgi:hypothetical protein